MNNVKELIEEINNSRTQISSSVKDEVRVMKAMLNDPTFKVDIWSANGINGQYCPYEDARSLIANVIKDTTKISNSEAIDLANNYQFGNKEASIMIGLSKEFVNTYLQTGRKLPLGGREKSNISIAYKTKEGVNSYPKKIGVDKNGADIYETFSEGVIPAHGSLKVYSSCPSWLYNKDNK